MAGQDGYAGVMLSVKFSQFWRNSANCDSVRDRGTECTVHRAENSRRREVAKPGIALGSGTRDRGFESRLPDHSQKGPSWPTQNNRQRDIRLNQTRREERRIQEVRGTAS